MSSTTKAFLQLLKKRGIYKHLGVTSQTVSNWRKYATSGKISEDKMQQMLLKAGAKLVQDKVWELY